MSVSVGREVFLANRSAVSLQGSWLDTVGGWEALFLSADSTICSHKFFSLLFWNHRNWTQVQAVYFSCTGWSPFAECPTWWRHFWKHFGPYQGIYKLYAWPWVHVYMYTWPRRACRYDSRGHLQMTPLEAVWHVTYMVFFSLTGTPLKSSKYKKVNLD